MKAEWSDTKGKWVVDLLVGGVAKTEEADVLINATGFFSNPRLPNIPGLDGYEGHLRHSSQWDPNFDPTGKRVAVIGNGASGLQVVANIQKQVKHLDHYCRSKTWIASSFGAAELNREERGETPHTVEEYHNFRKARENALYARFSVLKKGGEANASAKTDLQKLMAGRLGDRTDLLEAITPDFSPNCRRLTPAPGYLEALTKPNVGYITTPISKITKTGIETADGVKHDYDAIICSTGADISFAPAYPIIKGDFDLQQAWRPTGSVGFPDTYLGIAAPNIPNYFAILGPNSGGQAGTVPHALETQITYVGKVLRKISMQGIRTITPTQKATDDFRAYCESFFPKTVFSEECSSWYNGGIIGGRIHVCNARNP